MDQDEYTIGEVVQLKSGGPLLTVQRLDPENMYVQCVWFDGDSKLQQGNFKSYTLKLVSAYR